MKTLEATIDSFPNKYGDGYFDREEVKDLMESYAQYRVNNALQEAAEKKWIKVKNEKPSPAIPVITFGINSYGKKRTLRAVWVPKFFLESDGEYSDYVDYNEEKDEYYWPEGWYERNEYDEVNWHVDHEITHWQPLPDSPVNSLIPKEQKL